MSISKESNGTYTLNYTKYDVITRKAIRTKKRGFSTIKEAREYERTLSRESSVVTFYSLFKECQENLDIKQETIDEKENKIKKHLPVLYTIKYEELTKPYLLQLRSKIDKFEVSNVTKNKLLNIITSTCKYANTIYDLPDNSKVLKPFKREKHEMSVWTVVQYQKFEDALSKSFYKDYVPFFHALFFTGMRKGEAKALLVDDFDLENKTLSINKSMRRNTIGDTKTSSSVRKIKLDIKTYELLKPLKNNEKWLFGDYKHLSNGSIDRAFENGIKNSGVPTIRIHDLRHSHATMLINSGANIVAVSKRLGHSSVQQTLETYTHLLKETETQLLDILNVATL